MVNVYGECEYSIFHDKYVKLIMILYKAPSHYIVFLCNYLIFIIPYYIKKTTKNETHNAFCKNK